MKRPVKNAPVMRSLKLLHILVFTAMFAVCAYFFYIMGMELKAPWTYMVVVCLLYLVLTLLLGRIYRVYMVGSSRVRHLVYSQSLTSVICAAICYVVASIIKLQLANPLPLLVLVVAQIAWNMLWSFVANRIYYRINKPRKTVVVYKDEDDLRALREVDHFDKKFQIIKHLQDPVCDETLTNELEDAAVVFVAGVELQTRNEIAKYCITNNIQCYFPPRVGDVLVSGADHMQAFSVPLMRVQRAKPAVEYLAIKRAFDIVASLLAIILTSPFMLVTAIAIKAYDKGPVLYKQVRLTKDRKEFKVLKFRSMRTDAEKDGVARLSTENDDRITPVGKIIRKIRFDELPQLFNILGGDMTIVGPRPERPEIAEQYEKEIPSFGLRLQVKAGLTGYAQVYGRYNTEPYDKLKMDLMYINRMSIAEDLRIMLATVKILFMKESTEGIEEGQTTASHKAEAEAEEKELQNV